MKKKGRLAALGIRSCHTLVASGGTGTGSSFFAAQRRHAAPSGATGVKRRNCHTESGFPMLPPSLSMLDEHTEFSSRRRPQCPVPAGDLGLVRPERNERRSFGAAVCRDRGFVAALRGGRSPRRRTVDLALAVMGEPPAGPSFLREVEAFLAVTGGQALAARTGSDGQPLLRCATARGVSPKLATVEAVRAAMKSHASPAERREIRARAGAMPAILTGAPLPLPEPPARSIDRDPDRDRPARRHEDRGDVDTREAAKRLGLSPSTLARYRITGAGPWYYRFGGCMRYAETDLEAWDASRRGPRGREAARQASS